jgi:hypothetical protein
MLSCMIPIETNLNTHKVPIKYFFIEDIDIHTNLKKSEIERILLTLLSSKCGMNVIGYNKYDDTYWCKNVKNNSILSYYKMQINCYRLNINSIKIIPVVSTKLGIIKFKAALKVAIFDCECSSESSSDLTSN